MMIIVILVMTRLKVMMISDDDHSDNGNDKIKGGDDHSDIGNDESKREEVRIVIMMIIDNRHIWLLIMTTIKLKMMLRMSENILSLFSSILENNVLNICTIYDITCFLVYM